MPVTQYFICREKPTGAINSVNTTFYLANTPNANTEQVFLNGVLQNAGASNDYTISSNQITFSIPPQTDDVILVNYLQDVNEIVEEPSAAQSNAGRLELIHWCLRRLGAPVVEINVDDDQIEDRINEALMYFRDYHFDGVERLYMSHKITASNFKLPADHTDDIPKGVLLTGLTSGATAIAYDKSTDNRTIRFKSLNKDSFEAGEEVRVGDETSTQKFVIQSITLGDIDNGYIPVTQKVISVTNILPQQKATIGGNFGGMFDFQYQFALHNMFNLASTDLVTYDIYQRYMSTWEFMFRGTKGIRFNRKTDRIYIDVENLVADQWLVIEAWSALDPATYSEIYMDEFVREYAYNLIKLQWGTNLKKFTGIQLPGSVTLNGQAIYDEAKDELEKLRERVKKEFELPPDFLVG